MAGASYDLVILSSSPPAAELYAPTSPRNGRPTASRVAMSPPSLFAFSPPSSPKRTVAGASKTNLRAAPIPEGAVRGFATVGSLVRSEHFANPLDDDFAEIQHAQSRRNSLDGVGKSPPVLKAPRKRPTKKSTADNGDKPKPKPRARKPRADKDIRTRDEELRLPAPTKSPFFADEDARLPIGSQKETVQVAPELTKSGKPRKPRAKKQKGETGDTIPEPKPKRSRVTKAKPKADVEDGRLQREDAHAVSAHFRGGVNRDEDPPANELGTLNSADRQNAGIENTSIWDVPPSPQPKKKAPVKQRPPDPIAEGLHLDEAVARRRDWTSPPQDTTVTTPFTDSVGQENKQLSPAANGTFTYMLSNFAYAQSPSAQISTKAASSTTEAVTMTKRRRVELVEVPSNQTNSRNSPPEKGKAPKKKARTITDLVTEQYTARAPIPDPQAVTSDSFRAQTTTTKVPLKDAPVPDSEALPKKAPRKCSKSESDSEKTGSKARPKKTSAKAAKPKPVAEKLLSPASAALRLNKQNVLFGTSSQLALEESPTMVRQLQLAIKESENDIETIPDFLLPALPSWSRLGKVAGKRGLWAASTRDDEGSMLEHMNDMYIPEPYRTQDIPLLMDGAHDESFVDIDDLDLPPAILLSSDLPSPPRFTSQVSQTIQLELGDSPMKDMAFEDIDSLEQEPPPSNQNVDSQNSFADIDDFSFASPQPTLGPLARATTNASPPKGRGRSPKGQFPIPADAEPSKPLLKRALLQPRPIAKTPYPSLTTPKSSSRFVDIEEILDSEGETLEALSPTPPRIRNSQHSEPLPLISLDSSSIKATSNPTPGSPALTPIFRIPTSNLQWVHIKAEIFNQIAAHIRALPPTTNPKQPSWHEGILMYDPIVLEDFTAYLNTHTNIRTYKKATQKQIKAWNQMLKRDGQAILSVGECGEEVLAVEKELEANMVQGWCESMSVCCIWGEGRGKGGVRKGFY